MGSTFRHVRDKKISMGVSWCMLIQLFRYLNLRSTTTKNSSWRDFQFLTNTRFLHENDGVHISLWFFMLLRTVLAMGVKLFLVVYRMESSINYLLEKYIKCTCLCLYIRDCVYPILFYWHISTYCCYIVSALLCLTIPANFGRLLVRTT